jgi:hypothetical protein
MILTVLNRKLLPLEIGPVQSVVAVLCYASLVSLFGNGHKKMFHYHYCEPWWMRLIPLVPHDDFS